MVEINFIDEKKNKASVEFENADHLLLNSLKGELWNDEHVKVSGYRIKHPLIAKATMTIETDSAENPRKALTDAAKRLKKINEKISKDIIK